MDFKRIIAKKHHGKIDRTKFMEYFESMLSKPELCDDIQTYYKTKECKKNLSAKTILGKKSQKDYFKKKPWRKVPLFIHKLKNLKKTTKTSISRNS